MMHTKAFIEKFICKTGETIEQLNENEWQIQKWTTRTFRAQGNVLASEQFDTSPKEEIIQLKLRPNSRKPSLPISKQLVEEALNKGWIVQEIRFMKDGRTPKTTMYRMGPGLFRYEQLKLDVAAEEERLLKQTLIAEINESTLVFPALFLQKMKQFVIDKKDAEGWPKGKVQRFHHFLIAYLRLKRQKAQMEYKEIGATYYRMIGGSKAFDANRDDFIERLEKWVDAPVHELGIISLGTIVPIYFTGNMTGKYAAYSLGTVHATTDIALTDESFHTDAKILWLVENRAVLNRVAKEEAFLKESASFIIGVDGQIRGAHRKMIKQLCHSPSIQKVLIWVDYDNAGQIIARNLVKLVEGISYRIIGNEGTVFSTYQAYVEWAESVHHAEQEMTLGGITEWKTWISQ